MCGLIGYLNKKHKDAPWSASDMVAEQYEEQKSRGQKGFGMIEIFDDGTTRVSRATGDVKMMVDLRLSESKHILLHHRMPTSSENLIDQTHPLYIEHEELEYQYLVNHNGVISNAKELRPVHEALGYAYQTAHRAYEYRSSTAPVEKFNDSESFAIEFVRHLEGRSNEIASFGPQAFNIVQLKDGIVQKVIIGTNGMHPMHLSEMSGGYLFASELNYEDMKTFDAETALTFKAVYSKEGVLESWKVTDGFPKLIFAKRDVGVAIRARYDDDDPDYHTIGFHRKDFAPPPDVPARSMDFITVSDARLVMGEAGKGMTAKEVVAAALETRSGKGLPSPSPVPGSYARVLQNLRNTRLGKAFDTKEITQHDLWPVLDYPAFEDLFARGKIAKAEDEWNKHFEEFCTTELDVGTVFEEALLEGTPDFRNVKSLEDMERMAVQAVHAQMAYVASQLTPIFKMQAFMQTALQLGHAYKDVIEHETPARSPADELHKHLVESEILTKPERDSMTAEEMDDRLEFVSKVARGEATFYVRPPITGNQLSHREQHDADWGTVHLAKECKQPEYHAPPGDTPVGHMTRFGTLHAVDACRMPEFHEDDPILVHGDYRSRVERHYDYYGPGHIVSDCGGAFFHQQEEPKVSIDGVPVSEDEMDAEIERSAERVFENALPSHQSQLAILNEHYRQFGQTHAYGDCFMKQFHPVTGKDEPDDDAADATNAALDVLGHAAGSMNLDEVLSEAENIAIGIRVGASSDIESQLEKMASSAAEDGVTMRIGKYEDAILDTVSAASERFKTLASIVKAAKEDDAYVYGEEIES